MNARVRLVMPRGISLIHGAMPQALIGVPDASIHCAVTSPPYLWARDYGCAPIDWPEVEYRPMAGLAPIVIPAQRCALGLEATPEAYVGHLVAVLREVWRVLRVDGSLWLNLGDTYASGGRGGGGSYQSERRAYAANACKKGWRKAPAYLKDKDLVGVPWRVALALQADGWWLRSDVIWAKPNPMPESIEDRPTKSHEHLFVLARSGAYYYDLDALREPAADPRRPTRAEGPKAFRGQAALRPRGPKRVPLEGAHGAAGSDGLGARSFPSTQAPAGRNKRDVWVIATQPYNGAHFATMPEALAANCIRASSSERGCCRACGAPWRRVVEMRGPLSSERERVTVGWSPKCACAIGEPVPCRVLDCFAGSGTVGQVARELGRHAVLVEAQAEYLPQIAARIWGETQQTTIFDAMGMT